MNRLRMLNRGPTRLWIEGCGKLALWHLAVNAEEGVHHEPVDVSLVQADVPPRKGVAVQKAREGMGVEVGCENHLCAVSRCRLQQQLVAAVALRVPVPDECRRASEATGGRVSRRGTGAPEARIEKDEVGRGWVGPEEPALHWPKDMVQPVVGRVQVLLVGVQQTDAALAAIRRFRRHHVYAAGRSAGRSLGAQHTCSWPCHRGLANHTSRRRKKKRPLKPPCEQGAALVYVTNQRASGPPARLACLRFVLSATH